MIYPSTYFHQAETLDSSVIMAAHSHRAFLPTNTWQSSATVTLLHPRDSKCLRTRRPIIQVATQTLRVHPQARRCFPYKASPFSSVDWGQQLKEKGESFQTSPREVIQRGGVGECKRLQWVHDFLFKNCSLTAGHRNINTAL